MKSEEPKSLQEQFFVPVLLVVGMTVLLVIGKKDQILAYLDYYYRLTLWKLFYEDIRFTATWITLLLGTITAVITWRWWTSFLSNQLRRRKVARARRKAGPSRLFLGLSQKTKRSIYLSNNLRSEHVLVLGSTGTGKTTSVLEPAMVADIQSRRRLIFITAKEEPDSVRRLCSYAEEAGRIDDLRIFGLSDSLPCHRYNPLLYGDATALRDLCLEAFTWDNSYYRDQAKSALLYILTALRQTKKTFTLRDLYYVFTERDCLDLLAEMVTDPEVKHHLEGYSRDWTTFRDNMRGLAANLEDYTTPKLRDRLCHASSEINLMEAYKNNQILIFVLNSLQYGETARRLGRMVIQNIRYLAGFIGSQVQNPPFLSLYIDEFHHFIYPEFFSMIAQCRSSNIGVTLSTQSFADLKGQNWDITTQVIQNTNTKVILRQNDADSAELAARLAGTRTVSFLTEQVNQRPLFGQTKTGMGTVKSEEEFIIHPNQIRMFPLGKAACLIKGQPEIVDLFPVEPPRTQFDFFNVPDLQACSSGPEAPEAIDIYGRWRTKKEEERKEGIRRTQVNNQKAENLST